MGLRPCWTVEPSIDIIAKIVHHHLKLSPDEIHQMTVNFQFQGAFNKLYAIECPKGSFFMRVSLPVDPYFKTVSEVATVKLLESKTSVPVPQTTASDSSDNNELKFEWILVKRVPGLISFRLKEKKKKKIRKITISYPILLNHAPAVGRV